MKMKLQITSFFIFLTIFNAAWAAGTSKGCPKSPDVISPCICYEPSLYLVCDKIDETWLNGLKLTNLYELDTLVITNSPNLPLFNEKFHDKKEKKGITFKSLVFVLNEAPKFKHDDLQALVDGVSETLEIKIAVKPTEDFIIDAIKLNPNITSISLSNVKVTGLDKHVAHNLSKVKRLFLENVDLDKEDKVVIIDQPTALTHIEIINCPKLTGSFQFIPSNCKGNQQIVLNLKNNDNLIDFKMDKLFSDHNCKYHIDLSGSKLNPNFLTQNHASISSAQDGQLFMILRDVSDLECKDCTYNWFQTHKAVLHSVECKDKKGNKMYLDQFKPNQKDQFDHTGCP